MKCGYFIVSYTMKRETFLEKANKINNNFYNYDKTIVGLEDDILTITCPIHGDFEQKQKEHIRKDRYKKCPSCWSYSFTIKKEDFIKQANEIHHNKYDYSLVEYLRTEDKIKIICPKHGIFEQLVRLHLDLKCNCPKCASKSSSDKRKSSKEEFIEKANAIHNNFYDYSISEYINCKTKIKIICNIHGVFEQTPSDHLTGKGCPLCAREVNGWTKTKWLKASKGRTAKLYVLECFDENEKFIKIGRTFNSVKRRYGTNKELPYKYNILHLIESKNFEKIWNLERDLFREFKNSKYEPFIRFPGRTECFNENIKENLNNYLHLTNVNE